MIYGLLKNRRGSLKKRSNGKVTVIKSEKRKSNSFVSRTAKKRKNINKNKRFYFQTRQTNTPRKLNANIHKLRHFLK